MFGEIRFAYDFGSFANHRNKRTNPCISQNGKKMFTSYPENFAKQNVVKTSNIQYTPPRLVPPSKKSSGLDTIHVHVYLLPMLMPQRPDSSHTVGGGGGGVLTDHSGGQIGNWK